MAMMGFMMVVTQALTNNNRMHTRYLLGRSRFQMAFLLVDVYFPSFLLALCFYSVLLFRDHCVNVLYECHEICCYYRVFCLLSLLW
jgi:uncharacterized membrane protein YciS (DUF1049 family)